MCIDPKWFGSEYNFLCFYTCLEQSNYWHISACVKHRREYLYCTSLMSAQKLTRDKHSEIASPTTDKAHQLTCSIHSRYNVNWYVN